MDIRVFNALKPYVGPFLGPAVTTPTYTGTITQLNYLVMFLLMSQPLDTRELQGKFI